MLKGYEQRRSVKCSGPIFFSFDKQKNNKKAKIWATWFDRASLLALAQHLICI